MTQTLSKKTLVLIQGYHLDETSWDEIKSRIPTEEFNVMTLGRLGRDLNHPASLKEIATMSCQAIPDHSVLVAHSYGGAISTAMFGICPEKIFKIIYISAIVPNNGEKPFDRMNSKEDQGNYAKAVTFSASMITPKDPQVFYSEMDPSIETSSDILPHVYPESLNLTAEKLSYDAVKFKKLSKAYIVTTKDPVVGSTTQRMFIRDAGITQTIEIPTGHFPMIAQPEMLTEMILKLAKN